MKNNSMHANNLYMSMALELAQEAYAAEEVPVGCVIVLDDKVIGRGFNRRNGAKNALYHAEMLAIGEACEYMGDWRLEGTTLYVTVEPCAMCAGAIVNARIPNVVYGCANPKAGCAGSILDILNEPRFNHRSTVISGIMEEDCARLMSGFFARKR
jgi:tRNA(adenine34) deaminase